MIQQDAKVYTNFKVIPYYTSWPSTVQLITSTPVYSQKLKQTMNNETTYYKHAFGPPHQGFPRPE